MSLFNSWWSFATIDACNSLHLRSFERHTKNRKKCSFQNVLQFVANECRDAMGWRCALRLALQLYRYIIYICTSFRRVWGGVTIFWVLRVKPSRLHRSVDIYKYSSGSVLIYPKKCATVYCGEVEAYPRSRWDFCMLRNTFASFLLRERMTPLWMGIDTIVESTTRSYMLLHLGRM